MLGGPPPAKLAARLTSVAQQWMADSPAARADRAQRKLLASIADQQPVTLNAVASAVGRGAPTVSRSVDTMVRAGLVERIQDPDNRRRLQLSVTREGQAFLAAQPQGNALAKRLERFAASELRAI